MVIRKTGCNTVAQIKPNYNDSEIPIFRNESRIWRLSYGRHLKIQPYDYQHNNIHWLKAAEDAISRGERFLEYIQAADLIHFKTKRFDYYLDPITSIIYDHDSIWNCKFRCHKYVLHGGVLCDEVGLGKTLSMTGLILNDKYRTTDRPVTQTVSKPKAHKATEPKSTEPSPNEPKATEPSPKATEPSPKATEPVKIKIKAKINPKIKVLEEPEIDTSKKKIVAVKRTVPLGPLDPLIPIPIAGAGSRHLQVVKSTLVMCPRRLVSQWITEIQKYTDDLNVIEMSTLTHVKKYRDMAAVDVVVASFSLFDNKNYLSQDYFRLNQIHWRRVIIDEGHEVLLHTHKKRAEDLRISTAIFSIKSDFRWICTGTPLPAVESSLQAVLSYLNNLGHNEMSPLLRNINHEDYMRLMEMVFHRNTRQSIKEQISIPKHRETVEFLEFTKTERAIYDSIDPADVTRKLQVCTNLSVSETDNEIIGGNILNLSQVTKAMGAYYMKNCDGLESNIESSTRKIKQIEEERDEQILILEEDGDKDQIARVKTSARNRIKTLFEHIKESQLNLIEYRKQLQTFRSLDLDHISRSTCPVMGMKLKGKVAITPDGYYYSMKGVELLFLGNRKVAKCACTRKPIQLESLTFVDTSAKPTMPPGQSEEEDVERSKWGTKMSHVVNKLRQLFQPADQDAKVIIFSQWQKMLLLMSKALNDCNINHVFCRGNVHMMSKSIRLFKTDPKTRVILLSSDSCNSGSNLTEASYVFLIDAVSGDIEHAKMAETQAIARTCRIGQIKEVQVYRFVISNSIEEEYYKKIGR
jgi:SNF2 family DNA or RNA helicase